MIVTMEDSNYNSDEFCTECDLTIHTDGSFEPFECPKCKMVVIPCNVCPHSSDLCNACPLTS